MNQDHNDSQLKDISSWPSKQSSMAQILATNKYKAKYNKIKKIIKNCRGKRESSDLSGNTC